MVYLLRPSVLKHESSKSSGRMGKVCLNSGVTIESPYFLGISID